MPTPKWQPGQSGNPKGRPPNDRALAALIRKALAAKDENGIPQRKVIVDRLVTMAASGDLDAIKVVLDRVDGKAVETVELSGPDGAPIPMKGYVGVSPDDWPGDRG